MGVKVAGEMTSLADAAGLVSTSAILSVVDAFVVTGVMTIVVAVFSVASLRPD